MFRVTNAGPFTCRCRAPPAADRLCVASPQCCSTTCGPRTPTTSPACRPPGASTPARRRARAASPSSEGRRSPTAHRYIPPPYPMPQNPPIRATRSPEERHGGCITRLRKRLAGGLERCSCRAHHMGCLNFFAAACWSSTTRGAATHHVSHAKPYLSHQESGLKTDAQSLEGPYLHKTIFSYVGSRVPTPERS